MSQDDERNTGSGQDGVDLEALKAMQWRNLTAVPTTDVAVSEEEDSEDLRSQPLYQFSQALVDTYDMEQGEAQRLAFIELLGRMEQLGLELGVFTQEPKAAGLYLDLVAQHINDLSEEDALRAVRLMFFMTLDHEPETTSLIVDAINTGHQGFLTFLSLMAEALHWAPKASEAGPKLLRLLRKLRKQAEGSQDETQRWHLLLKASTAAWWLRFTRWPEAVPALEDALRSRSIMLRAMAMQTLVTGFPDSLRGDKLTALLDDALLHPPPKARKGGHSAWEYASALVEALVLLRPPEALAPLLRVLRKETVPIGFWGSELDDRWAALALAAAFPHLALDAVDRLLADRDPERRAGGVEAALRLPPEHARERLQRCLGDCYAYVDRKAREGLAKLDGACPEDSAQGLFVELLEGPLSAEALESLQRLRGSEFEEEFVRLWSSPPSAEWLVVLLLALSRHPERIAGQREDLPRVQAWPQQVLARLRALPAPQRDTLEAKLVCGLVRFVQRFPNGLDGFGGGFEAALQAESQTAECFTAEARQQFLETYLGLLAQPWVEPFGVLRFVGSKQPLPSGSLETVWNLALGEAIGHWGEDGERAARLAATLLGAQTSPAFTERLRRELPALLRHPRPQAVESAVLMAMVQTDPELGLVLLDFARGCDEPFLAMSLLELPQDVRCWPSDDTLDENGLAFVLALKRAPRANPDRLRASCLRALDDTACGSAAAVAAASLLLFDDALARDDSRLDAIAERAHPAVLPHLLHALTLFDSEGLLRQFPGRLRDEPQQPIDYARLAEPLRKVFSHADERVVSCAYTALCISLPEQARPLLEELSTAHPSPKGRRLIRRLLGLANPMDEYWYDP
ncbi:MAG: hypothetical protein RBU37_08265 [Myxococcota bacterium]|jgi:hypothetical protein|nr:hypothetical protein [Myxococcota bacterium]